MGEKHKCCETVYRKDAGWGERHQKCGKTAKVEADGKWYCGLHTPEAEAKRAKKREQKYEEFCDKSRRLRKQIEFSARCAAALRGIDDPEAWVKNVCRVLREACDEHEYLSTAAGTAFDRARAKMRRDEIDGLLKQLTPAPHGGGTSQDASGV